VTLKACTKRQTFTKSNEEKRAAKGVTTGLGTIVHYSSSCQRVATNPSLQSALTGMMVVIHDEQDGAGGGYTDRYICLSFDGSRWRSSQAYMYSGRARQYHYDDIQAVRMGVLARRSAAAAS
jgi:hypothetical protein